MLPKSKRNSIWVINKYASAREQGFETRTLALAREWRKSGRDVSILSSAQTELLVSTPHRSTGQTIAEYDGVKMVMLKTTSFRGSSSWRRAVSWFDFELKLITADLSQLPKPDIVIVSSLSLFSVVNGIRLSRRYRCPWVFEVRDIWPLTLTEEGGVSPYHPLPLLMAWIERLGYQLADAVVGTMPNLSPHASRVAGRFINCTCIPFGFDPSTTARAEASKPALVERIPRGKDRFVIGYAGSMGVSNALETFIEASLALSEDARFQFVLCGDGDLRQPYMQKTARSKNVHWLGKVRREEVQSVLQCCDVLYFGTHPSKVWDYGMSLNKLTDYLLAAKPVLASYSGYPSIINEARCGEFVPAGNVDALISAIHRYASKPATELAALGEAGYWWLLRNRSWGTIAQRYLELIDALPRHE